MHDYRQHQVYPFTALVGQEPMRQALLCAVINPFEEESDGAEKLEHVLERLRESSPTAHRSRRASPGLPPG